ncbi:hypothetical protein Hoch_4276 [Haliangium ochraceum DSM 14365]|uniref:Uncharacterized protein n=1 Tax=Haliangium ochraceum (strain DSM 14365 / JCM 11303 / SMP-2) TaxID=502025 RepID=D0LM67_HALO1|nr:hypothetical protein Hoch_4276 [Haliangium ochraceum DSM 14365]
MSQKNQQRKPRIKGNKQRRIPWPCDTTYLQLP